MRLEKCDEEGGLEPDTECPICGGGLIVISEDGILTDQTEVLNCPHCSTSISISMDIDIIYSADPVGPINFIDEEDTSSEEAESISGSEDVGVPVES